MKCGTFSRPVLGGILCGLVLLSCTGSGSKAKTPKDALINMATAIAQGNTAGMKAVAHYTDEEVVTVAFDLALEMTAFEEALDEAYGIDDGQSMTSMGFTFPGLADIQSDGLKIVEKGDKATASVSGKPGDNTRLIRKDGSWYVDLTGDMPTGSDRDQMLKIAGNLSGAFQEANAKIGEPGLTRQDIEMGLMGNLMGAAMGFSKAPQTPPPTGAASWGDVKGEAPSGDDPIAAIARELTEAAAAGDMAKLRELVAEDCQVSFGGGKQPYWNMYNDQVLEAMKQQSMTTEIEEINVLERTPDQVTVRVKAISRGTMGTSRGTTRNIFRKYDGRWMLAETAVESAGFSTGTDETPGKTDLKILPEAVWQHVQPYPGARFAEVEVPWGLGTRSLFGADKQLMTCLKAETPDEEAAVIAFYKQDLHAGWFDVKEYGGARGAGADMKRHVTLCGEKEAPGTGRIGINVRVERTGSMTTVYIVLAPLGGAAAARPQASAPAPVRTAAAPPAAKLPELPESAYESAAIPDSALSQATKAAFGSEARSLEFPGKQPIGGIYIRDWGASDLTKWERFEDAQHKVVIPAGREVKLVVNATDLSFLSRLHADDLHTLRIIDAGVDDSQLAHVAHLTSLKSLNLRETAVTDSGLSHLESLSELAELDLRNTQVTDTGLQKLNAALTNCSIRK